MEKADVTLYFLVAFRDMLIVFFVLELPVWN